MHNKIIPLLEINNLRETKLDFVVESMEDIILKINEDDLIPHRHDYYTIIWTKNATGTHTIDFVEYQVSPNCLYFLNPNQVHLLITDPNPVGYVVMFKKELLTNYETQEIINILDIIFNKSNDYYNFNDCNNDKLLNKYQSIINLMLETYSEIQPISNNISQSKKVEVEIIFAKLVSILLSYSIELINTHSSPVPFDRNKIIFDSFNNLVANKYKENHQVIFYAKLLNLSSDYLSKVVKEVTGKSAKEIIKDRILLEAKRYIFHSNCSLKEISFYLGFEDVAQFSKFFKLNTGQTFKDFKQSNKIL